MTNSRIHAIDSLRTQSLLPFDYDTKNGQTNENLVIVCKASHNIKSILRKPQKQSSKQLRFATEIKKVYIVENWKMYNLAYEDDDNCCCKIQ